MKKVIFTLTVLALTLLLVNGSYAQTVWPVYNRATQIFSHAGVIATTANDTTGWISLSGTGAGRVSGAYDVSWFGRSNDSLRATIHYQLKNTDAHYTGAWVTIDTILTVDDAVSNNDTTTIGVTGTNNLTPAVLKGANQIRFYFDYDKTTPGTAAISVADGVANMFRFYLYVRSTYDR